MNYHKSINVSSIFDSIKKISYQGNININQIREIKHFLNTTITLENNILNCSILGIITLCEYNNLYYCIDGQHRLKACYELIQPNISVQIQIHVIKVTTYKEMRTHFKRIHKSIQVPDYLLYEENDDNRTKIKNVVCKIVSNNLSHFTKKTKSTRQVRRPSMRQYELEDHLYNTNHIIQMTEDNIINLFKRINNKLNKLTDFQFYKLLNYYKETAYNDNQIKISKWIQTAKKKSNSIFLLGLFPNYSWLLPTFETRIDNFMN